MEKQKIKVAILFGGRSTEHQISLLSAKNIYHSIDKDKFEALLIGIDKAGTWHLNHESLAIINSDDPDKVALSSQFQNPILLSQNTNSHLLTAVAQNTEATKIDVVFPVLHGTYGEDGSVQGLAKLANLPCVGSGILGSAVGMDKDIMKHVLRSNGVKVADWLTVRKSDKHQITYEMAAKTLGKELFVKPANLGSSVGVSQVKEASQFDTALDQALKYDHKVIIEEKIIGREIECAVLGNNHPQASIPGEVVVPKDSFYSFENKYIDDKGATLHIPAELTSAQIETIQALSLETYKFLECKGMTRVDMFMTEDEQLIINEVNTIPGFTKISMYPKLWEISGLSQKELITKLINLAIEEHKSQNSLLL